MGKLRLIDPKTDATNLGILEKVIQDNDKVLSRGSWLCFRGLGDQNLGADLSAASARLKALTFA
jgi:hypothetical protein